MKKLLIIILSLVSFIACAFTISACGGGDNTGGNTGDNTGNKPEHTHSYTAEVISPTCTEKGYTLHTRRTVQRRLNVIVATKRIRLKIRTANSATVLKTVSV